jgi:PAS domain S-box-containing protein
MTIYAIIPLASFFLCTLLGSLVSNRDAKSSINRLFGLMAFSFAAQSFIEFGYRQSNSLDQAMFWWRLDVFWAISVAILLHFTLSFTEKTALLKRKWIYFLIYMPAIALLIYDQSTHLITGPPKLHPWGWAYSLPEEISVASLLLLIWNIGTFLVTISLCLHHCVTAADPRKRSQARFVALGFFVGLLATIWEQVFFDTAFSVPFALSASMAVGMALIAVAVWRHKMFALTPITAAESIVTTMTDSLLLISPMGSIMSINKSAQKMLGYDEYELTGQSMQNIFPDDDTIPYWLTDPGEDPAANKIKYLETELRKKNGKPVPVSLAGSILRDGKERLLGSLIIARDITQRKQTDKELQQYRFHLEELVKNRTTALLSSENERSLLEQQLLQSQKMEAIGRLAGGVAHDFNNLLMVIQTYTGEIHDSFQDSDPRKSDMSEVIEAAKRAEALTQQLLAFSRKQAIDPQIVNLNDSISNITKMLGRIIGEDVQLSFLPCEDKCNIKIDTNQLDQVLTNLAVNARDAMPEGGRLSIESSMVTLTESDVMDIPEAKQGTYIRLIVRDNGCGMSNGVTSKIFEPFYTTKGRGKGTGLGLATVYGIVRQNNGFIRVESTIDVGTTFSIYLPPSEEEAVEEKKENATPEPCGTETILVVEDENMVRRLATRLLKSRGYRVLVASDANEAIQLYKRYKNDIDLLLTDIVMPGKSGKQLSKQLTTEQPSLRVLYMSGYNDELIDRCGIREKGVPLIEKPFTSTTLSFKVREALDA